MFIDFSHSPGLVSTTTKRVAINSNDTLTLPSSPPLKLKAHSALLMDFHFVEELRVDCQSRVLERLNRKLPHAGCLKGIKFNPRPSTLIIESLDGRVKITKSKSSFG
jgi:hypothetical protein